MYSLNTPDLLKELTVVATFSEVFLAKEGHDKPVGLNLLEKIQLPNIFAIYGAMLADVDYVFIGAGILLIVLRYDWLVRVSGLIGAVANTTTLFLFGFFVLLMMCLQFSLVISLHRRQIKRLTQTIALLQGERRFSPGCSAPEANTGK